MRCGIHAYITHWQIINVLSDSMKYTEQKLLQLLNDNIITELSSMHHPLA